MGHVLFVVLHIVAVLFGFWALLITVPLHLIYGAVTARRDPARPFIPGPGDIRAGDVGTVPCPECREPVRGDARKCKHCGSVIQPQSPAA